MEDLERYKIAKEVATEWRDSSVDNPMCNFDEWVDEKLKPVDERFERFKELMDYLFDELEFSRKNQSEDTKDLYSKFNELFPKDNGTKGLKMLLNWGEEDAPDGCVTWGWYEASKYFFNKANEIKKELEA